jgi:hypothetical protein
LIIEVYKYTGRYALAYDYPPCRHLIKDSIKLVHKWNYPVKFDLTSVELLLPEFATDMLKDFYTTLGYKKPKKFVNWINGNDLVTAICESSLLHVDTWWRDPRYKHAVELLESNVV